MFSTIFTSRASGTFDGSCATSAATYLSARSRRQARSQVLARGDWRGWKRQEQGRRARGPWRIFMNFPFLNGQAACPASVLIAPFAGRRAHGLLERAAERGLGIVTRRDSPPRRCSRCRCAGSWSRAACASSSRYCIGGCPTNCANLSANAERDNAATCASASIVQSRAGLFMQRRERAARRRDRAGRRASSCVPPAATRDNAAPRRRT